MRAARGATVWHVTPRGDLIATPITEWRIRGGVAVPVPDIDAPRTGWIFAYQVREGGDIRAWNSAGVDSWRIIDARVLRRAFGRLASGERDAIERAARLIPAERLRELEAVAA